jgi:hypothetical protein
MEGVYGYLGTAALATAANALAANADNWIIN